jgi:hypothetical protein
MLPDEIRTYLAEHWACVVCRRFIRDNPGNAQAGGTNYPGWCRPCIHHTSPDKSIPEQPNNNITHNPPNLSQMAHLTTLKKELFPSSDIIAMALERKRELSQHQRWEIARLQKFVHLSNCAVARRVGSDEGTAGHPEEGVRP